MKIVGFQGLTQMPRGTIYAEWEPLYHESVKRLGDVIYSEGVATDFFYCDVFSFSPNGCGPCVSNIEGRWGLFDYDQKFLIWEPEDVAAVIRILTAADTDADNVWPEVPI